MLCQNQTLCLKFTRPKSIHILNMLCCSGLRPKDIHQLESVQKQWGSSYEELLDTWLPTLQNHRSFLKMLCLHKILQKRLDFPPNLFTPKPYRGEPMNHPFLHEPLALWNNLPPGTKLELRPALPSNVTSILCFNRYTLILAHSYFAILSL